MKAAMYAKYAMRSLARGGQRSVFAVFCVAIGVLVIVALQLVGGMVNAALSGNIRALNGGDIAVHTESHDLTTGQLTYFAALKSQGLITDYTASVSSSATTSTASGLQRFGFETVDPAVWPLSGGIQFLTPANASLATVMTGNTVVVTESLQQYLHVHPGDTLTIITDEGRTGSVTIGGVIANTGFLLGRPDMLLSQQAYDAMPSLAGAPAGYTWLWVNVPSHSDVAATAVSARIRQHFPLVTTTTVRQAEQDARDQIQGLRNFLQVIGLLALLIGGVGIINTMQVLLRRRLLEIAMLKTTGYRQRDLLLMFGLEAALLGIAGGALGAAAGVGVSLLVSALVARAFFMTLPVVIDPLIVASGVAIGCATTLIFGLLPIAQNSAVRPLAVLREAPEPGGCRRAISSTLLVSLLGALFFLLALSILRNPLLAFGVVAGAGLLLSLLTFCFAGLAWLLSKFTVPNGLRWGYLALVALALLVGAALLRFSPGLGVLLLILGLCGTAALLLPRGAKADIRLAMRNIGRAKLRNATTLVALFCGVFAIGIGLALGQGLKDSLAQLAATHEQDNAFIIASGQDAPLVSAQLAHTSGISHLLVTRAVPDTIVAVNGVPLAQLLPPDSTGANTALSGLDGVNLAAGDVPPVTLARGFHDAHTGRNLGTADAATMNALLPQSQSQPPLNLKLGDTLTVSNLSGSATATLRIVGFYSGGELSSFAPVLVDSSVVNTLGGDNTYTVYALHLDPTTSDATLQRIKRAVPGVITLSLGVLLQQVDALLDNIIELIETLASLAMLAGIIMVANIVALAMLERRREMGILKAVGHTSGGVLGMILIENAVIGITSASLALLLVLAVTTALGRLIFTQWSSQGIVPALALGIVLATAALCAVVAASVAWSATRVRPLEVLRYE
ncbi:MAG: hypothetical protein OJF49_001183 [Ktedonobacterales bacterium]|jgi:predicted lysophospholipase L1 biosynthesis ABC-type transport system permease subunit|nr:MAG: hypothetical protein OJF49_001183 [Ktedonobacterales bacterium]